MKTAFATAAAMSGLASLGSAQAYFSLIAAHSASPIHLQEVNASGESFWIGKETAAYCPESVGSACPKGEVTTLAGGQGSLSMAVVVPGGQQVYIDPACGAVKYTQAHSAYKPEGAISTGWTLEQLASFGELEYTDGVLFCSVSGNDSSVGPWQMFAALPDIEFGTGCLGASLIASNTSSAGAWQYT